MHMKIFVSKLVGPLAEILQPRNILQLYRNGLESKIIKRAIEALRSLYLTRLPFLRSSDFFSRLPAVPFVFRSAHNALHSAVSAHCTMLNCSVPVDSSPKNKVFRVFCIFAYVLAVSAYL